MPKVLYTTPTGKRPHCGYHLSVVDLCMTSEVLKAEPWKHGDYTYTAGPVQMARSSIAMQFVGTDSKYLLMHDDDLAILPFGPHGNPIDRFVEEMDKDPKIGLLGAVYLREHPRVPLVQMWHPKYPPRWSSEDTKDWGEMVQGVCNLPHGYFDCAGIGTGFVMIRREAMEAILSMAGHNNGPPFRFRIDKNRWGSTTEVGEDFDFCHRLQKCGYRVVASTLFPTVHFKDSGQLRYDHQQWQTQGNIDMSADPGSKVIEVNGITCIDVSEIRRLEALERDEKNGVQRLSIEPMLLPQALREVA